MKYSKPADLLQKGSYQIIGICMGVLRILCKRSMEIVWKDAIEYEVEKKKIPYDREKKSNIIICESVAMIKTLYAYNLYLSQID